MGVRSYDPASNGLSSCGVSGALCVCEWAMDGSRDDGASAQDPDVASVANGWEFPPLPLLSEVASLRDFLFTSLDDAVEDIVKLLFVWMVHKLLVLCLRRWLYRRHDDRKRPLLGFVKEWQLATTLTVLVTTIAYSPINEFSDFVGNIAQGFQDSLAARFGIERPLPQSSVPMVAHQRCFIASFVDDMAEDIGKLTCVSSHAIIGGFIGSGMTATVIGGIFARVGIRLPNFVGSCVYVVFVLGTPASRYTQCNDWADRLGDQLQQLTQHTFC